MRFSCAAVKRHGLGRFRRTGLDLHDAQHESDQIEFTKADPTGSSFRTGVDDEKLWERNLETKYVIQSGAAKNLPFRVRQATHRSTSFDSDLDEAHLIIEYPMSIL
ncbi:outer membrane porin, OprD family [compost metagenome]